MLFGRSSDPLQHSPSSSRNPAKGNRKVSEKLRQTSEGTATYHAAHSSLSSSTHTLHHAGEVLEGKGRMVSDSAQRSSGASNEAHHAASSAHTSHAAHSGHATHSSSRGLRRVKVRNVSLGDFQSAQEGGDSLPEAPRAAPPHPPARPGPSTC